MSTTLITPNNNQINPTQSLSVIITTHQPLPLHQPDSDRLRNQLQKAYNLPDSALNNERYYNPDGVLYQADTDIYYPDGQIANWYEQFYTDTEYNFTDHSQIINWIYSIITNYDDVSVSLSDCKVILNHHKINDLITRINEIEANHKHQATAQNVLPNDSGHYTQAYFDFNHDLLKWLRHLEQTKQQLNHKLNNIYAKALIVYQAWKDVYYYMLYIVTYTYNDPNIDWGIKGDCSLIAIFSSQQKIKNWIQSEHQKDPTNHYFKSNELDFNNDEHKQILGNDITDDGYYEIIEVPVNQITNQGLASWWHEE